MFGIEEARALAQLGRLDEAATAAISAGARLEGCHPGEIARGYTQLAGILDQAGQPEQSLELYELAIGLLEQTPSRFLADAYTAYGELLERLERHQEAYAIFKRAAHLNTTLHRLTSS